jgi:hypothetical protein
MTGASVTSPRGLSDRSDLVAAHVKLRNDFGHPCVTW